MARIITICNNKGGVGKTTTAVNLGAALRLRGYNVLLVDYDGQANLTEALRVPVTDGNHIYAAMQEGAAHTIQPVEVLPADFYAGSLSVLPSVPDVAALDVEMAGESDRITRFSTVVAKYREQYDVILIDTPPTMGLQTLSALYAADEVIVTVQPQYLAARGLVTFANILQQIQEGKGLQIPYTVLFTQFDKRKSLHKMTIDEVEGAGIPVFATRIRDNVTLGEAPAAGCDIFSYDPHSNGAADYSNLAIEYLSQTKLK